MDTNLLEIFKVLGISSIAFIIWLIIKEIGYILKNRNNSSDVIERIKELEKLVNNDYQHDLEHIWSEIQILRKNDDELREQIASLKVRLAKLEK